ncbi:putative methionyl-tRNA synthetase [Hordeum vulgare]|nr:putative methionyl-tRNA synthetase [Hordeum vulgare]
MVSFDPITDANQNADRYSRRVKTAFDERKMVDPEFSSIHMDRGDKPMANHWATIQQSCNKWHRIQEEVIACPESGANVERQMVRMFDMYRPNNNDAEFKFLHVFTRIESCEKWTGVQLALAKAKDGVYNLDAPVLGRRNGALMAIRKPRSHSAMREEKSEARWSALMAKKDIKLDLLRANVTAKKRNGNLAYLMGADMATMDPHVNAWTLRPRAAPPGSRLPPPPVCATSGRRTADRSPCPASSSRRHHREWSPGGRIRPVPPISTRFASLPRPELLRRLPPAPP